MNVACNENQAKKLHLQSVTYGLGKRDKRSLLNEIFRKIEILFTMFHKNSIKKKLFMIRMVFVIRSLSYHPSSIMAGYLIHHFNYVYEVKLDCIIVD